MRTDSLTTKTHERQTAYDSTSVDDDLSSGRRLEKNDDSHRFNRINTRYKTASCPDRFRTIRPILS